VYISDLTTSFVNIL